MRKLIPLLVCLAAPSAWAAIPDANGVIHGCRKTDGTLRVIDSAAQCALGESVLNWSATNAPNAYFSSGLGREYQSTDVVTIYATQELRVLKLPAGNWIIGGSFSFDVMAETAYGYNVAPQCSLEARAGDGSETELARVDTNTEWWTFDDDVHPMQDGLGSAAVTVAVTLGATKDITLRCQGRSGPWKLRSPSFTAVKAASIVTQSVEPI